MKKYLAGTMGLLVLALAVLFILFGDTKSGYFSKKPTATEKRADILALLNGQTLGVNEYLVTRVIDGDTFDVADVKGQSARIRLIGIDTPETVDPRKPVQCFGKAASTKMRELAAGKIVRLEKDPTGDTIDKYGRLLRLAYLGGTLINAEMIKEGYAYAYTFFPFSLIEEFKEYQRVAERNKVGLWDSKNCPTDLTKSFL